MMCFQCGGPSPPFTNGGPIPLFCSCTCRAVHSLVTFARNACEAQGLSDLYIESLDIEVDPEKVADHRDELERMARARRSRKAAR